MHFSSDRNIVENNYKKLIQDREYYRAFQYFAQNSSYKVLKSPFYKSNEELYKKCFAVAIPHVIDYFKLHEMDLIEAWIGKSDYRKHISEHYAIMNPKFLSCKTIHVLDEFEIQIDGKGAHYIDFYNGIDSYFYNKHNIFSYFLWSLEAVLREATGYKRKLMPSTDFLRKCATDYKSYGPHYQKISQYYSKLADLYESDEYSKIIYDIVQKNLNYK